MSPIILSSADDTAALAVELGAKLQAGDVLLLEGDIGAGKTHFARSLIQSLLTVSEDVPSPTFTLVQMYETEQAELWHADLYRLTSPDEVVELGLVDAFEDAICLVEWPDRLAELRPENALTLTFALGETTGSRILTPSFNAPRWASVVGAMSDG
ncbi:tRNA (adenosine(37)-N6)-threonylcarbamoyltransferase complex ATPase subunit type 1 TsaE [Shimia sp. Alg240-R146]|uniref:tRNA (adenosine(37)-N6)-threonylcarbamoyltransferase complex ATPase subunit type 1 TsaE n=1 Tax=Shimia sp. Alg240-R146 TaxID=2993449 RepID=UPI0022E5464C|nr:tRNA (adenosine(37)-N6)-threonylcarbamoyltransferase complex ATPase subunit type 1 TsaE [Shimia sp. Alg240-R146]